MELADVTIQVKFKDVLENLNPIEIEELFEFMDGLRNSRKPYQIALFNRFLGCCENFTNADSKKVA